MAGRAPAMTHDVVGGEDERGAGAGSSGPSSNGHGEPLEVHEVRSGGARR